MIAECYIDKQGKLSRPLIQIFAALLNLSENRLGNLVFRFNASKTNKAETWGKNDIRINPEAYARANDAEWIGTLAHELTHEYHYFKSILPDFLVRFFDQFGIKFREWILRMPHEKAYKSSPMEKNAFANQKMIMDCVNKYTIQKILTDSTISESEKISSIQKVIGEYKKDHSL